MSSPESGAERILWIALLLLASAIVFRWAWHIIEPLLPIALVALGLVIAIRLFWSRRGGGW
jgi:hypothetical protein